MSDNWIILIPEMANFVPSEQAQSAAVALLSQLAPLADEVRVEVTDRPRLINCGSNLQRIVCPDCGCKIAIPWWQEWVDDEADADFPLNRIALPCCRAERTLAELDYDWPQGFSRFSIEAMNPNIRELPESKLTELESILGCELRTIWQHL